MLGSKWGLAYGTKNEIPIRLYSVHRRRLCTCVGRSSQCTDLVCDSRRRFILDIKKGDRNGPPRVLLSGKFLEHRNHSFHDLVFFWAATAGLDIIIP